MRVKDAMNPNVITLSSQMSIREAAEIMAKRNIGGAPVVDKEGKLIGILTLKDILNEIKKRMEAMGVYIFPTPFDFMDTIPVEIPQESQKNVFEEISSIKVESVMSKRVHHVREDDDIEDALFLLVKKGLSRLPVVNSQGKVVGILTRSDLLRALARSQGRAQEISKD